MGTIQRCLQSRKLQRLGKCSLLIILLFCFVWLYAYNFSKTRLNREIDIGNYSFTLAGSKINNKSGVEPLISAVNIHIWRELCGFDITNLRQHPFFPRFPDEKLRHPVTEFHIEDDSLDYDQVIFGFVHSPDTMSHRFAIVSDDTSELWLSSSEDPSQKQLIARVFTEDENAWVLRNQLDKYPGQISEDMYLLKGSKYYFEVLHKQGIGDGFVQVFWKNFQEKEFKLISSEYLSLYSDDISVAEKKDVFHSVLSERYLVKLEQKSIRISKEYLDFLSLPLIPKDGYLTSCEYKSSLVYGVTESLVYPEDDTVMCDNENGSPNRVADGDLVRMVVDKIATALRLKTSKKYFVRRIHNVMQKSDPVYGDRYSVDLELSLNDSTQSFRLSEHVFHKKLSDHLCFPDGMDWNYNATVYFILPIKEQARWVYHFINELTVASLLTGDTNFYVIVVDFESQDINLEKAFDTSLLRTRHTVVTLQGKFYKTLALNKAVERVPSEHDILFLFDLHIDVPVDILNSVRKNTVEGRLVYMPVVGRLDCESTYVDHRGYWETPGFGILSVYKSDWIRFGGMNTRDFKYNWGGEDWDLVNRVLKAKLEVERIKHPGLYHHYQTKQGWK